MILFVLGLLIGGCVGMLLTALCVVAKFEFCCQQKDCKSCPFHGEKFFVLEQGYITCGLYQEPGAWSLVWNKGE